MRFNFMKMAYILNTKYFRIYFTNEIRVLEDDISYTRSDFFDMLLKENSNS